jgi:hypothetical protein
MAKDRGEDYEIDWFEEDVALEIAGATQETLRKAAFFLEAEARLNIQRNGQIDTSFMINSSYVVTPDASTYGDTNPTGRYTSAKQAAAVDRERAPAASLPGRQGALVAFAAVYTFWQELQQPFLFPALESTQKAMGGIIKRTAKEKGLD